MTRGLPVALLRVGGVVRVGDQVDGRVGRRRSGCAGARHGRGEERRLDGPARRVLGDSRSGARECAASRVQGDAAVLARVNGHRRGARTRSSLHERRSFGGQELDGLAAVDPVPRHDDVRGQERGGVLLPARQRSRPARSGCCTLRASGSLESTATDRPSSAAARAAVRPRDAGAEDDDVELVRLLRRHSPVLVASKHVLPQSIFREKSKDLTEWVRPPTEMKSTPAALTAGDPLPASCSRTPPP